MTQRKVKLRFDKHNPADYAFKFTSPSLTEQSAYDDVNIHSIVARGMNALPANTAQPMYNVNLKEIGDYQSVLQRSADLKNSFEDLPREVREKFKSPEELVEFCNDKEKNLEEGQKLGIFAKGEEPSAFEKAIENINKHFSMPTPEVTPEPAQSAT